jgi:mannose-6-phosphate isomerase-like protein (cupin superfamily)
MIEKYLHEGIGYNPVFIRDGWQVAKLNPLPGHGLNEIDKLEVHNTTDEIFILIQGVAVLIAADMEEDIQFEIQHMQPGVIYNIPKKQWHNIAMGKGAELIIVEKDNTHLQDCTYKSLSQKQQNELKQLIQNT